PLSRAFVRGSERKHQLLRLRSSRDGALEQLHTLLCVAGAIIHLREQILESVTRIARAVTCPDGGDGLEQCLRGLVIAAAIAQQATNERLRSHVLRRA